MGMALKNLANAMNNAQALEAAAIMLIYKLAKKYMRMKWVSPERIALIQISAQYQGELRIEPNPPPPGVSITKTSPDSISTVAVLSKFSCVPS